MTSRDFCFWLQGYMELSEATSATGVTFTPGQYAKIKSHLALVFKHEIDPSMGGADHQKILNEVHNPLLVVPAQPHVGPVQPHDGNVILRC